MSHNHMQFQAELLNRSFNSLFFSSGKLRGGVVGGVGEML